MFGEQGFVVIRGLFSPEEIDALQHAYSVLLHKAEAVLKEHINPDTVLAPRPDGPLAIIEHSDGVRYDYTLREVDQAEAALAAPTLRTHTHTGSFDLKLAAHCGTAHPTLAALGGDENPKLLAVAAALLGINPDADERAMVQIIQQAHFKGPGSKCAFVWHQDSQFRRFHWGDFIDTNGRGSYVNIAVAMDGEFASDGINPAITPDGDHNGPLGVIPDTWRGGHLSGANGLDQATVDPRQAQYPLLQPGDALCVGPFIVHGSNANNSATSWRRSFITGFALPDAIKSAKPEAKFDATDQDNGTLGMSWFKERQAPQALAPGDAPTGRVQIGGRPSAQEFLTAMSKS